MASCGAVTACELTVQLAVFDMRHAVSTQMYGAVMDLIFPKLIHLGSVSKPAGFTHGL